MGSQYKWISVTPEEIENILTDPIQKQFVNSLFATFLDNRLTYKARTAWFPKKSPHYGYTIHFYIKKSKEAIIMNATTCSFGVQLRINDASTFEKLDEFSENVRNSILNGQDSTSNDINDIVFIYNNKEYRKRYELSANFRIRINTNEDVKSLMYIIHREINFNIPKRTNIV